MVGHLKYRNNEEYKKKSKEEKAKILGKYAALGAAGGIVGGYGRYKYDLNKI